MLGVVECKICKMCGLDVKYNDHSAESVKRYGICNQKQCDTSYPSNQRTTLFQYHRQFQDVKTNITFIGLIGWRFEEELFWNTHLDDLIDVDNTKQNL